MIFLEDLESWFVFNLVVYSVFIFGKSCIQFKFLNIGSHGELDTERFEGNLLWLIKEWFSIVQRDSLNYNLYLAKDSGLRTKVYNPYNTWLTLKFWPMNLLMHDCHFLLLAGSTWTETPCSPRFIWYHWESCPSTYVHIIWCAPRGCLGYDIFFVPFSLKSH